VTNRNGLEGRGTALASWDGTVLVAIDGTESRKMQHSSVRAFYEGYTGAKRYFHGPNRWVTGADLWPTVERATQFVLWNRRSLGARDSIDLVGHSRGGMGVIVVAQRLHDQPGGAIPVRFMGLFDAVDRTPTLEFGRIPSNVGVVSHAVRDPRVGSRSYFGNTGLHHASGVRYRRHIFPGSHSGLGGDPWRGDHPHGLTETADIKAAEGAYSWIVDRARNAGVPVRKLIVTFAAYRVSR